MAYFHCFDASIPRPAFADTGNLSRRTFLVAVTGASSVLGAQATRAQTAIWQEYRRDDVGFLVEMPGRPRIRVEKADPEENWITSTDAQVFYQNEVFDVSWTEFKDIASAQDEYTRFRNLMNTAGYQIETETSLTLNGLPVLEFIIERGNIHLVRRILAVRNLALAIHATGGRNLHNSPSVRRFLDSFSLLRT
jgi:hypothetical protein